MKLAAVQQLIADALPFSLEGDVPTQATIDARRQVLAEATTQAIARREDWLQSLSFATMVAGTVLLAFAIANAWDGRWPEACLASIGGGISFWAGINLDSRAGSWLRAYAALQSERSALTVLNASDCANLLAACHCDSECEAYRQRVLEQHRRFVQAERNLLLAWAGQASERKACAALYEVGDHPQQPGANPAVSPGPIQASA